MQAYYMYNDIHITTISIFAYKYINFMQAIASGSKSHTHTHTHKLFQTSPVPANSWFNCNFSETKLLFLVPMVQNFHKSEFIRMSMTLNTASSL